MKKLSDIEISFISLVKNPANKKGLIFKSSDKEPEFQKEIIFKSLSKDGVAYGIVYSPYEVDSQGDWTDEEEIKKACHNFLKNKNIANIDKEHSFLNEKAFVCESWIIKNDFDIFPNSRGAWAVGIKINDAELKELINKGEITGLSMAGFAKKTEEEMTNLSKGEKMPENMELLKSQNSELESKVKSLEAELITKGDEAAAIIKSKDEKIAELEKALSEKDTQICEIVKSHKSELVERLVKSGEMLPSRKDTALSLDGKAYDEFCEVCKSEAKAVLGKSEFSADEPKKELDSAVKEQLGL